MVKNQKRNRGPKGRRVRNGSKQSLVSKVVIPYACKNIGFHTKSLTQNSAVTNGGSPYLGRFYNAHPFYGMSGGSISTSTNRTTITNATSLISGLMLRFITRKFRMDFTVHNLEAFPVIVTLVPMASTIAVSYQSNNVSKLFQQSPGVSSVVLQKNNVFGSIQKVSISVDCAKLEGISPQALEQASFWANITTLPGLYQAVYLQAVPLDGVSVFTNLTGIDVNVIASYDNEAIQPLLGVTQ